MTSTDDGHGLGGNVFVDGEKLKSKRLALGWTQEEAAAKAGHTERLIRKLESGGPVPLQTLEDVMRVYCAAAGDPPPSDLEDLLATTCGSELEQLARSWFERAYNQRDMEVVDELMHPDVVLHAEGCSRQGRDVIRNRVAHVLLAFNPLQVSVDQVICRDDQVTVHWNAVKTHVGEFLGVPASNKTVTLQGKSWARFIDGRMIEVRDEWDVNDLIQKLRGTSQPA